MMVIPYGVGQICTVLLNGNPCRVRGPGCGECSGGEEC